MCRSIRTLYNFKPPATEDEIRASSLQFVRKLSGFHRPSKANEVAFDRAVDRVARTARELIDSLVTSAPPRDRVVEASKARARAARRLRESSAAAR
jgi:hypothetical protein